MKIKNIVHLLTPPIITKTIKKYVIAKRQRVFDQPTGEKNAGWYNQSFIARDHWKNLYYKSSNYFIWTVIVDRLLNREMGGRVPSILELGCGSGQLANYLLEAGVNNYVGIDFSTERIKHAEILCEDFIFVRADFFKTDFNNFKYNTVICLETLEHIEEDITLIKKLKPGISFIGSVPDFPFVSHVRYFANTEKVFDRYGDLFHDFTVHKFIDTNNDQIFLLSGITK